MRAFFLVLLLGLAGCTQSLPGPSMPTPHPKAEGPKAANFSLLSPDGEKVEFTAGARYEVTVISFWSPSWDPDHEVQLSQMQALRDQSKEHPVRILLICYDEDPENIRRYLQAHPVGLTVAMGDTKVYDLFHLEDIPTTILVGPEGSIIGELKGHVGADAITAQISPFFPQ